MLILCQEKKKIRKEQIFTSDPEVMESLLREEVERPTMVEQSREDPAFVGEIPFRSLGNWRIPALSCILVFVRDEEERGLVGSVNLSSLRMEVR